MFLEQATQILSERFLKSAPALPPFRLVFDDDEGHDGAGNDWSLKRQRLAARALFLLNNGSMKLSSKTGGMSSAATCSSCCCARCGLKIG